MLLALLAVFLILVTPCRCRRTGQCADRLLRGRHAEQRAAAGGGIYRSRDPSGMMETLVAAAEAENWDGGPHAGPFRHRPGVQAEMGPVLAKRMFDMEHRGMWLNWGDLSDRPDAMATNVSAKNPMAGEPRRNIRLAILELPDRPVSVRIARVKPADGEPVWLFSRQTVGNIWACTRSMARPVRAVAAGLPAGKRLLDAGVVGGGGAAAGCPDRHRCRLPDPRLDGPPEMAAAFADRPADLRLDPDAGCADGLRRHVLADEYAAVHLLRGSESFPRRCSRPCSSLPWP